MKPILPKNTLRFLRWFCKTEYLEEIEGDLTEVYEREVQKSPIKAKWKFRWSVLKYIRPIFIDAFKSSDQFNPTIMVRHNLLLTFRSFKRYKMTFLINLTGLSTGLACAFLIFMWVNDELNIDRFYENEEQIYQVMGNHTNSQGIITSHATPGLFAETIGEEFAQIKYASPATWPGEYAISGNEKSLNVTGHFVGKDYFNIFSIPFIHGDKAQVLENSNSIVISKSLALRLYNSVEDAVGEAIVLEDNKAFQISGVYEDLPATSSIQYDFAISFEEQKARAPWVLNWSNNGMLAYFMLQEGADVELVSNSLTDVLQTNGGSENIALFTVPFINQYLYGSYENGVQNGGRIEYVRLFSIIAIFILGIACINFMNLSTAQASRRVKEIGVKKAIGSGRLSLIVQYLSESQLIAFLGLITAMGIVVLFLPEFNDITGKDITFQFDLNYIFAIFGITIITGLLAGSYPALLLSSYKPIEVLKGNLKRSNWEKWTPKGLVVFQFALSVLLIVTVLVIYKQVEFIQNKNLGYDRENIVQFEVVGEIEEHLDTFISELKKQPGIVNASSIGHSLVGTYGSSTSGISWDGKDPDTIIEIEQVAVNYNMIELLNIEMKDGRPFSEELNDSTRKVIFNEAAIAAMGLENPVGQIINLWGDDREIIGVAKDFHFKTLHQKIDPQLFVYNPSNTWMIMAKIEAGREKEALANIQAFHQSFNPNITFEYRFMDAHFEAQYAGERRIAVLSRYFAGIAIIISCLGLFGLAAFTAQRRRKEIGIRKVLGSSEFDIVRLLSNDFTAVVLVAITIALPISYFFSESLLSSFAFRIDLSWWYFASAGLIALLVAWFTVSLQTIKAARVNPTQCLKDD